MSLKANMKRLLDADPDMGLFFRLDDDLISGAKEAILKDTPGSSWYLKDGQRYLLVPEAVYEAPGEFVNQFQWQGVWWSRFALKRSSLNPEN